MSFSLDLQTSLNSSLMMSEQMKKAQEQLKEIMLQNQMTNKYNSNSIENLLGKQVDEINTLSNQTETIQKDQNESNQNKEHQAQNMINSIGTDNYQDLQSYLQILTDQKISKPPSQEDLKNLLYNLHQGLMNEQEQTQQQSDDTYEKNYKTGTFTKYESNQLNKIDKYGQKKSKSPILSARSQQIIEKKQMQGEYKPIHQRLNEIKQHYLQSIMKTNRTYPKKEEPIPTFKPQINQNSCKIIQDKRQDFYTEMKERDEQKQQKIKQKQEEKQSISNLMHTFHPVINPSTSAILEKSQVFGTDYDPQNVHNVVDRLYSRMKQKQQRNQQREQQYMSLSPFKPKINQNSEKLFFKMCNGIKVPFEERMKQRIPLSQQKQQRNQTPNQDNLKQQNQNYKLSENQQINHKLNLTPQNKQNKFLQNNQRQLQESNQLRNNNIQNNSQSQQKKNLYQQKDQSNLENSISNNRNYNKNDINTNNQKYGQYNTSRQNEPLQQSYLQERTQNNQTYQTNQPNKLNKDQQKENSNYILISDGVENNNKYNSIKQSQIGGIQLLNTPAIKNKCINSQYCSNVQSPPQTDRNNISCVDYIRQQVCSGQLSQSICFSDNKNASLTHPRRNYQYQRNEDKSESPVKSLLNLSSYIVSPRLQNSPLQKSPINYNMTVENQKLQKADQSSLNKLQSLNTQISPQKYQNVLNQVDNRSNLKYAISIFSHEDK